MQIRPMQGGREAAQCNHMIFEEWGADAAERFREQSYEYLRGGKYAPNFLVAALDGNTGLIGVAAYQRTMRMNADYDLIWIRVHPHYQSLGAGRALTEARLDLIKRAGGNTVTCVTQKPDFFAKFGFAPVAPYGNDWTLMLKRYGNAEI